MKRVEVVIGIVRDGERVLICRRRADNPVLPGYWEFPGGKVESGETREDALRRELSEELQIDVRPTASLEPIEHAYPTAVVTLWPYVCELLGGTPTAVGCAEVRWVRPADLPTYEFPPANADLIRGLSGRP
ncbi:MAG TPA: 8-oxo-dGTP diphosphatase MutT [Humisphaera sp.]